MTFDDVLTDIRALIGLPLQSIKAGATITIIDVEPALGRIRLSTPNGAVKSRPISELRLIWTALAAHPAIHVDAVFEGSGSSRNQPETIFANLPYVEFIRIKGRKHILLCKPSHAPGTIREASLTRRLELEQRIAAVQKKNKISAVIYTNELAKVAKSLESLLGTAPIALYPGEYQVSSKFGNIVIRSVDGQTPPIGTYVVLPYELADQSGHAVSIGGNDYIAVSHDGLGLLLGT